MGYDSESFFVTSLDNRIEPHDARMKRLGINEEFIDRLVNEFYSRIRTDNRLGPIFDSEIQDWEPHLAKMKRFWSSIILLTGSYSGNPIPAHQKLEGITSNDFTLWLALFEMAVRDVSGNEEVVGIFADRARRIAQRLASTMTLESSNNAFI